MAEVHATGFKTVAPSLDGTIARTAALAALRRAAGPTRWLTGASGTGKSTLVASHVRDAAPSAWYRLDARDDDPAFFYANLGAALERAWPQEHRMRAPTDCPRVRVAVGSPQLLNRHRPDLPGESGRAAARRAHRGGVVDVARLAPMSGPFGKPAGVSSRAGQA